MFSLGFIGSLSIASRFWRFLLLDLLFLISLNHEHLSLRKLFHVLEESVSECDQVTEELLIMLSRSVHLEAKVNDFDDVVSEDVRP